MRKKITDIVLISDMDGTLLSSDHTISQKNLDAIRKFERLGGRFTIATGRSVTSAGQYLKQLDLKNPCILYNGASIYHYPKKKTLWQSGLPVHIKDYLHGTIQDYPQVGVEIITADGIYIVNRNSIIQNHVDFEHLEYVACGVDEAPDGILKVLFGLEKEWMDDFGGYMRAKNCPGVYYVKSFSHYFEMLPEGSSKGATLALLKEHMEAKPSDFFVTMGDYYNDADFIQNGDLGIAVGNAPDDIKALADRVVCENNSGAVAAAVELILNEYAE